MADLTAVVFHESAGIESHSADDEKLNSGHKVLSLLVQLVGGR